MRSNLFLVPILFVASASSCLADPPKQDGQWRGSFGAGLSDASGNTESTSFNLNAQAVHATPIDEFDFDATALYGSKTTDGTSEETANLARALGKYDRNLTDTVFGFGSVDLEHDRLQELDLRSVLALGAGYHLVKSDTTRFDISAGVTYNHETFTEDTRNTEEVLLAEESDHKLSDTTSLHQRLALYPNLTDGGQYRAQFDSGLVTSISEHLNLQIGLSDRYQSNPQPGIKKNDFLFLTSVNYRFGPK